MDPKAVVDTKVAAIERGEIPGVVVPVCDDKELAGEVKRPGRAPHNKFPIADSSADHLRNYKPGEKTTRLVVELVLRIMNDEGRPMEQGLIVDRTTKELDRARSTVTSRVSGALLWLRATGIVVPGRKNVGMGGQVWILQSTIDEIVGRKQVAA